jgi:SHS2 domain-containing protein
MKDEIDRLATEGFEVIEHTADWAYRVWGEDLKALFVQAAKGLYDLAGARLSDRDRVTREINLQGIDSESLLFAWLNELLHLHECENLGGDRIEILQLGERNLVALVVAAPVEQWLKDIKTATDRNLAIRPTETGLEVTILLVDESKKAIILIPGFYRGLYNLVLDKLQKEETGFKSWEELQTKDDLTSGQIKLEKCLVDIYNLDYSEEISRISFNEWINLFSSIGLLFYWLKPDATWLKSRKKQNFLNYKTLAWGLLVPSLVFICWYSLTLSVLLVSLADSLNDSSINFLAVIAADIKCFFNSIFPREPNYWQHLLLAILVLFWILSVLFFPAIAFGIEIAKFAKKYLESEDLRIKIRNRVLKVLNAVILDSDYTEAVVIAHSFGVLIGADAIGSALSSSDKSIKFISLGNNLAFLSRKKSKLITGTIQKCVGRLKKINKNQGETPYWIDYWAEFDWLCTRIDEPFKTAELTDTIGTIVRVEEVSHKTLELTKFDGSLAYKFHLLRFLLRQPSKQALPIICWNWISNYINKLLGKYHLIYFQDESYLKREDKNKNSSVIERILKKQILMSGDAD